MLPRPLPPRRQLFYDDEHGNIRRVSTLGVCSILVSRRDLRASRKELCERLDTCMLQPIASIATHLFAVGMRARCPATLLMPCSVTTAAAAG